MRELPAPLGVLAADAPEGWLVGGAVRDRLLGRITSDFDVVLPGDAKQPARQLAAKASGHAFELSDRFGAWRVVARERTWQVDLQPLLGETIEADLAQRDLTVNALAERLDAAELIDPFGGAEDLRRGRLRMVSPEAFDRDPLRTLRLVRIACELGFSIDEETRRAARAGAPGLAGTPAERVFAELKRILCSDRAVAGLGEMDDLGVSDVVLPELAALRGVEQSHYHHLDVHAHTMAVLGETIELQRDPAAALGEAGAELGRFMAAPLADGLTRWQALRFGALLHDIAKPQTREVSAEGRITFMGHDAAGAELTRAILARWRASSRLIEHVAGLVLHHLRLGFLVSQRPLPRRVVYRYLHACSPVAVDVTALSVSDRLATRGARSEQAIAKHLELAREMAGEALSWVAEPPRPPVRGDEVARALELAPGPELGRILAELEEASFAREIRSPEEAIARARELMQGRGG